MELFKEIVNESILLNEINAANDDAIKRAINNVLRVRITYDDRKDRTISGSKGKRTRYILPVAYGLTKNGKRAVRAYQTAGSTKRGVPKWKLFLLDNIISWDNGKESFRKYGDSLIKLGLNTTGDKHMTTLYAITPIGGENIPVAKNSMPIDSEPITKTDVSPTRNTVQNPNIINKTDDFVIPPTRNIKTSIDNKPQNNYFKDKVEAPETKPITKVEIQPNIKQNTDEVEPVINNEPITKSDVEDKNQFSDNKLSSSFKELMNRMDNINKEPDEEEEN
jgi:hypothetical protein